MGAPLRQADQSQLSQRVATSGQIVCAGIISPGVRGTADVGATLPSIHCGSWRVAFRLPVYVATRPSDNRRSNLIAIALRDRLTLLPRRSSTAWR